MGNKIEINRNKMKSIKDSTKVSQSILLYLFTLSTKINILIILIDKINRINNEKWIEK